MLILCLKSIPLAHCLNDALDIILEPHNTPRRCASGEPKMGLLSQLNEPNSNEYTNDVARDLTHAIRRHLRTVCEASLWFTSHKGAHAIKLLRIEAPERPHAGTPVKLRCVYETKGDKLQSLSWYKDGHEFYRYQPYERTKQVLIFNQTGVTLDVSKVHIRSSLLSFISCN